MQSSSNCADENPAKRPRISYNKKVSWKDEETESTDPARPELSDPAILDARPILLYRRYTHEELLKLKQAPLSQLRPEYLDQAFDNSNGIWDPERWHYERKRSETPGENGNRVEPPVETYNKRRSGDPRERIRKEQDGIILSPQRRSFNSGCFVPIKEAPRRPHSPLGKPDGPHIREVPTGGRRIGSGRILTRDVPWDYQDKNEEPEFNYRNDRFERRSFSREFEMRTEKPGRNGRFNDRRRMASEIDEPEWFSGGPLSQNDTIELRGFEDGEIEKSSKKKQPAQKKRAKERAITKNVEIVPKEPEKRPEALSETKEIAPEVPQQETNGKLEPSEQSSFNFDEILKCDSIPGLLPNGISADGGDNARSRFSRWFKRESPKSDENRGPSLQDEHMIKNLLNDISETNVTIPGDSETYFAPISPATNTGEPPAGSKPFNLMEILQRGKQQIPEQADVAPTLKNIEVSGKLLCLEELEARMLKGGEPGLVTSSPHQKQHKNEEDVAFKRFLAQVSASPNNGPVIQKPPMTILEMLSHSQQQEEAARLANAAQMMGPTSPNPTNSSSGDLTFKLQQLHNQQLQQAQQMEMLSVIMNAGHRQQPVPTFPEMSLMQSRELLSRPEAQAILQGLKRGDITPQHLHQQLAANSAMQPRHRDVLHLILKHYVATNVSNRVLSPVPSHPMFQQQQQPTQQQQQLRVSPLPPSAIHQRIPSPRELQVHTQNIMQRALIKKKLEEQQENFRKKQELQQRGPSPGNNMLSKPISSSPTPLAFTPTSVLRKMTAEKDEKDGKADSKMPQGRPLTGMKPPVQQLPQQWSMQQLKQPPGRAIVKANTNLQPASQQTQHQELFYQQQQRLFLNQRKNSQHFPHSGIPSQTSPNFNPSHQSFPGNPQQFQQQLRAQHQQQQPPQSQQYNRSASWQQQQLLMGHSNYDARIPHQVGRGDRELSPTSNQLARWFSPDLLERARAGKLPDMPSANLSQHAVNLEEIERHSAPTVHN